MDEDAAWYGSRPRPRPHCTRRGPSSHERGTAAPLFFGPCLLWPRSPISATAELLHIERVMLMFFSIPKYGIWVEKFASFAHLSSIITLARPTAVSDPGAAADVWGPSWSPDPATASTGGTCGNRADPATCQGGGPSAARARECLDPLDKNSWCRPWSDLCLLDHMFFVRSTTHRHLISALLTSPTIYRYNHGEAHAFRVLFGNNHVV